MMKMKTEHQISVHGCDDSTYIRYDLTEEESKLIVDIANKITAASTSVCQPTMRVMAKRFTIEKLTTK